MMDSSHQTQCYFEQQKNDLDILIITVIKGYIIIIKGCIIIYILTKVGIIIGIIIINCDNSAAINIIESDKNVNGVKHTEIEIAYLRQLERRKIYGMVKIHTNNNCADILTKALFTEKYIDIRSKLYNPSLMYHAEQLRLASIIKK